MQRNNSVSFFSENGKYGELRTQRPVLNTWKQLKNGVVC